MPDITIQDMSQEEVDALASRAARHGRTLEAELRHILHEAAGEELLVLELERATRAAEETLKAAHRTAPQAPPSINPPRRRGRAFEPTPRKR
jgi:plasmid stability protein